VRIEGFSNSIYSSTSPVKVENEQVSGSFGNTVRKAILEVNRLQQEADQLVNKLASGEDVELHQAMIAMQKASTALQFTIQVRNKIIEAYQEIMRMQV
jgi:flagellar hook-basal body complex protein FliE